MGMIFHWRPFGGNLCPSHTFRGFQLLRFTTKCRLHPLFPPGRSSSFQSTCHSLAASMGTQRRFHAGCPREMWVLAFFRPKTLVSEAPTTMLELVGFWDAFCLVPFDLLATAGDDAPCVPSELAIPLELAGIRRLRPNLR